MTDVRAYVRSLCDVDAVRSAVKHYRYRQTTMQSSRLPIELSTLQGSLHFLRADPIGVPSIHCLFVPPSDPRQQHTAQGPQSMTFPDNVKCTLAWVALNMVHPSDCS